MTATSYAGESIDLRVVQDAAAFRLVLPNYLPEETRVASGRWWAGGDVVEIHTATPTPDPLRGKLTIKEWCEEGVPAAGRPGRNPSATIRQIDGRPWFVSTYESLMYEGTIGDVYVQLLSLFSPEETDRVVASMSSA